MRIKGGVLGSAILAAVLCISGNVLAYSGGDGSAGNPYKIANASPDFQQLYATPTDWSKSFILTADIELSEWTFSQALFAPDTSTTIDFQGTKFTGIFDGNGHTVSNLTIAASTKQYIGLFGCVGSGGQILNLGLENVNITGGYYTGGLAGWNDGTLISCYATGSVTGTSYSVGGLVGENFNGTLTACYATSSVAGTKGDVGGLVGQSDFGQLTTCYATGAVSGGNNSGSIGGLVGSGGSGGGVSITACYATGAVSGGNYSGSIGGLVGSGYVSITACYATGAVSGGNYSGSIGGLMGSGGWLSSCYATGAVSGGYDSHNIGGLLGTFNSGSITTCFWDIQTSGQSYGVGSGSSSGITGKTTAEMQTLSTFTSAGWDFTDTDGDAADWIMTGQDYPGLLWEVYSPVVIPTLIGYTEQQAQTVLDTLGLLSGENYSVYDISISAGLVSETYPKSRTVVYAGLTPVHILLAKGTRYSGGDGITEPYQIADFGNLLDMINTSADWSKSFILTTDIDLAGQIFKQALIAPDTSPYSFGFQGTEFNGTFDGNGNVISNLTITASSRDYVGLFGQIGGSGGHIRNLGVENVTIIGNGYVGGLAGMSYGFFAGCHATGLVSGGSNSVGGLTGHCYGSMVGCYATCSVSATNNYVGGLAGFNGGGSMTACYATGAVSGIESVGGLVGSGNSITACYATGSVRGTGSVGGLVGSGNSITACYATGLVSGSSGVGGLVGSSSTGSITACFWDTQTSGQTTSAGGVGKTTAEMQTLSTFNDAGWDFIGENANGLNDYWQMEVNDYPHFSIYTWTLEGEGILANPYVVGTAEDLGKVWRRPWAYYQLGGNLDLSRISWSSAVVPLFTGVFDGQGFVISNLKINQPGSDYMGLFGNTGGSLIRNLGIDHVNIIGRNAVGGLVGGNRTTLISCYTTGSVVGIGYVGGLTGLNDNDRGMIIGCYATSSVSGTGNCIGGLVGSNYRGHVIHCYSTGKPTGTSSVGGLVGSNYRGHVIHCYSTGKPTGTSSVGGLCGVVDTGTGYEDTGNFWDTETSEINTGAMGTGKTTAEIMTLSTFTSAGWDFSNTDGDLADWMMLRPGEDTPRLAWQPIISGDIAGLYGVNIEDLDAFARQWLMGNCSLANDFCDGADIDKTGIVNLADFAVLAGHWQKDTGFPVLMQGHWTLDDATGTVALDSSGNLRNGTLVNGPMWNASGKLNGALQFDGVNDYVSVVGYKGILGTSSRTCMAWIKTPGTAQNMVILGWGGQQWIFGLFGGGELTVYAGGPYIKTTGLVNDDQWHHVAAVMTDDGSPNVSEITLYVDGILQTTVNAPGVINTPQANDVLIGAFSAGTPAGFFKGLLDDVRLYNMALSGAQIEQIFQVAGTD